MSFSKFSLKRKRKRTQRTNVHDFVTGEVLEDERRLCHDPDGRQHSRGTLFTESEQRDDRYGRKIAARLLETGFPLGRHQSLHSARQDSELQRFHRKQE